MVRPPSSKHTDSEEPRKKKKRVVEEEPEEDQDSEESADAEEEVEAEDTVDFDPSIIQADVASLLEYSTFEPPRRDWLDTDNAYLNGALGSQDAGIPFGEMFELAGLEHGGKTAIATILGGMAQRQGAVVGRIDVENSRDAAWDRMLGLDPDKVLNIFPKLVRVKPTKKKKGDDEEDESPKKGKKKRKGPQLDATIPILQGAEQLFTETEVAMARIAAAGYKKQFWFLDSIANLQTEMNIAAGNEDWNMRVGYDRAIVLSRVLPKWCGLAANYNASIFMLNQLRMKAGVVFGDPYDSPGGRALRHNCHIRARVRRCKGGELKRGGRTIGLVSIIKNIKNKAGSGSVQGLECGMRILWRKSPADITFMSKEEAEEHLK